MSPYRFFLACLLFSAALVAQAQPQLAVTSALSSKTLVAGGAPVSVDLSDYFGYSGVTGTVVQFDTVMGKVNVELLASDAPKSVANFINYLADGSYTNSLVHRSAALDGASGNRIIQGGGYVTSGTNINAITRKAAITLEYKLANARGTLAMARTSEANSATSEWFFNVDDNTSVLGASNNGGYAVFGRLIGNGMSVVDAIAALTKYTVSTTLNSMPLRNMQTGQTEVLVGNLIIVNKISVIPVHPSVASSASVVSFTATSANTAVVTTEVVGSTLTLRPVAAGNTTVTVRTVDTNGSAVESSFAVTVAAAPLFTTQPASQTLAAGQNSTLSAVATGSATFQWQKNGGNLTGVTSATVNITDMQPSIAGLYTAVATSGGASSTSTPAILGVSTTSKVIGGGEEIAANITHPNTKKYDQVLIKNTSAAITADFSLDETVNQVTRMSYIDLDDDIVQIEFSGPGTLSVSLEEATGPAVPVKYNQPTVQYVKGHASIVITGATEYTNISVFTVGRATAYDRTGVYNILLAPNTTTNNPANNGSPLFEGRSATVYDGIADLSRISIRSANGKFGGIRTSNASFWDIKGFTGIYAPGVTFTGPVNIGDITAYGTATPVLLLGTAQQAPLITGGDLYQDNGQPVQVSGVTQVKFQAGSDSHGRAIAASKNQGILHQNGTNVTTQIVVNP